MSRSRIFSKLIIPITLLTIYSIALYKTVTAPVEPNSIEGTVALTTASTQSLVEEVNNNDLPRPPKAPPAPTPVLNSPEKLRFVALTDPRMVPAAQVNWLKPDDEVLGIIHGGEAQAFPLQQMALHHVINTRIAGESFVVTYCLLCGRQAASFRSIINGSRFTFDIFGLYKQDLAMIDRQTGSVWAVKDGNSLSGPLTAQGISLQRQILTEGTWDEWLALHPDTTVLPQLPEYISQYSKINTDSVNPTSQWMGLFYTDKRLQQDEAVLGISLDRQYQTFVIADADKGLDVATSNIENTPIVIFIDEIHSMGAAYLSSIDDITLDFSIRNGRIVDETGSIWDLNGRAISGPHRGKELSPIASLLTQWGTWSAYHPETSIYDR